MTRNNFMIIGLAGASVVAFFSVQIAGVNMRWDAIDAGASHSGTAWQFITQTPSTSNAAHDQLGLEIKKQLEESRQTVRAAVQARWKKYREEKITPPRKP